MKPVPILFLAALLALPSAARASLPDGLYTTQAPAEDGPTPVGLNTFSRSGFTLRIGKRWKLAQPVLPLDMAWLKPWMEGPGVIVRVRGVDGETPADAAARLIRDRAEPGVLESAPFRSDGGLDGVRVVWGVKRKTTRSVSRATYLFANRPGFVYAFVAEPWPRGAAAWRLKPGDPLPSDALLRSAALERERVGYRP